MRASSEATAVARQRMRRLFAIPPDGTVEPAGDPTEPSGSAVAFAGAPIAPWDPATEPASASWARPPARPGRPPRSAAVEWPDTEDWPDLVERPHWPEEGEWPHGPEDAGPRPDSWSGWADPPALPGGPASGPPARESAIVRSEDPHTVRREDPYPDRRAVGGLARGDLDTGSTRDPGARGALPGVGAFDPGRRGVKALAAVGAVVLVLAGVLAWRSRPRTEPVAVEAPTATAPATGPTATTGEVVVAVAGRVRRPGLVRLRPGARVADAIAAAGGALPGTDVALLNLARKVVDGELIAVGIDPPPELGAPGGGAVGGAPGGKVNLNTASLAQLDALPGVGPVTAQRILDHRAQHGGFGSVSELREVEGIGDARFEQLKELVTV